ncbi:hypothetical protein D9M72_573670 [compost metagenome]
MDARIGLKGDRIGKQRVKRFREHADHDAKHRRYPHGNQHVAGRLPRLQLSVRAEKHVVGQLESGVQERP